MRTRPIQILSFLLTTFLGLGFAAQANACLGVARTISVNSFSVHKGVGPSGGIGLRNKEVVLTFDDGPSRGNTTRVLAALSRECTKATFFMVGRMAQANPGIAQRVARAGHTIAHHTHNHLNLANSSPDRARADIQRGVAAVNNALGRYRSRSSRIFRYPYLARSSRVDTILQRNGLIPVSAGIMSLDWKGGSGAAIVARVMNQLKRQGSGVILMHDINPKTASILPTLLRQLKSGGYKVVHLRGGSYRGSSQRIATVEPSGTVKTSSIGLKRNRATKPLGFFARWRARREAQRKANAARRARLGNRRAVDRVKTGSLKKQRKLGLFARWRARRQEGLAERRAERAAERSHRTGSNGPLVIGITRTNEPVRKGFFARWKERREKRRAIRTARREQTLKRTAGRPGFPAGRSSNALLLH